MSFLPLYDIAKRRFESIHAAPDTAHAGLWYDRFFNQYDHDCKVADDGKTNWINTVTGSAIGNANMLAGYTARQQTLIDACGGQALVMSSQWHFVTGLGNNHPVENGFAWHHTLGVPYLTGAAVKGMVRAWCEVWEEDIDIQKWFGDTEQSGELIFFDAVPVAPVQLKADIMTPHYGKWYAEGDQAPKADGSNVPADWHDPVPVPFLVVDKGQTFQFGVAKRAGSDIDLGKVSEMLTKALEYLGAGAKTAAGYGRMARDKEAEEKISMHLAEQDRLQKIEQEKEAQRKQAEASGLKGLAMEMVSEASSLGWSLDKGRFIPKAGEWLSRLGAESDPDTVKHAAQWLAEKMNVLDPGIMQNPDKTQGKKQKPVFKPATRDLTHTIIKYLDGSGS